MDIESKAMQINQFKSEALTPLLRHMGYAGIRRREGLPGYRDEIICCKKEGIDYGTPR